MGSYIHSTKVPHFLTSLIDEKFIYLYQKRALTTARASMSTEKIIRKTLFDLNNLERLAMKVWI